MTRFLSCSTLPFLQFHLFHSSFVNGDFLRTLLDGLAAAKMNTLHWHLTDSHSFPYVSSSVPQMSQYGAYLPGKTYTADDVAEIVLYAKVGIYNYSRGAKETGGSSCGGRHIVFPRDRLKIVSFGGPSNNHLSLFQ